MMKKSAKAIIRERKLCIYALIPLAVAVIVAYLVLNRFYYCEWLLPVGLVLFFAVRFLIWSIENKKLLRILTVDLDAETYGEVVRQSKNPAPFYVYSSSLALGDYQTAVNAIEGALATGNRNRATYYMALARAYFELDDVEGLKNACDSIAREQTYGGIVPQNTQAVLDFYQAYIAGDYPRCVALTERKSDSSDNGKDNNLARLNSLFCTAVAHYKNKDYDTARGYFVKITEFAPKMHLSKVAERYISQMDSGETADMVFPKVVPHGNGANAPRTNVFSRNLRKVICVLLIMSVGFTAYSQAVLRRARYNSMSEFQKIADAVLSRAFGRYEFLTGFKLGQGDDFEENFCFVSSRGKLHFVTYLDDEGTVKTLTNRVSDMPVNEPMTILGSTGKHLITVGLYDSDFQYRGPYAPFLRIEFQNKSYIFHVIEIKPYQEAD